MLSFSLPETFLTMVLNAAFNRGVLGSALAAYFVRYLA